MNTQDGLPSAEDSEVFQRSQLQVIVPTSLRQLGNDIKEADIELLLEGQRQSLFYDEEVPLLLLLRTPLSIEKLAAFAPYLSASVSVNLSAFPASAASSQLPQGEPPIKLHLTSVDITNITTVTSAESTEYPSTAIFRADVHLNHPDRPVTRPNLQFAASVFLKSSGVTTTDPLDDYLPSGIPLASNILSPLQSVPQFRNGSINLPSSCLERAIPLLSAGGDEVRPVRASSQSFMVRPAMLLRTSRTLFSNVVYLTLDVHNPPTAPTDVQIDKADCSLEGTPAKQISGSSGPWRLMPGDRTTFVFQAHSGASGASASFKLLSCVPLLDGTACKLQIFRTLRPPLPSQIPTQTAVKHWSSPHRNSRPSTAVTSIGSPEVETTRIGGGELKVSISGPSRVPVGSTFTLTFYLVNQCPRKRRLHILSPPLSTAAAERQMRTTWIAPTWADNTQNIAPAVLEARELYAGAVGSKQERRRSGTNRGGRNSTAYHAEIIPLDTEIKVGSLAAGACTEARLTLQALSVGVISVEGLVIVDLDSRETCLIGDGWEGLCVDAET